MRRAAITRLDLAQIDLSHKRLTVVEKGGHTHIYHISQEGILAIADYLTHERAEDAAHWHTPALFLAAATVSQGTGRLTVTVVNTVWNAVCRVAQVQGCTPHSARHAMGKHIIAKTGCGRAKAARAPAGRLRNAVRADNDGRIGAGVGRTLSGTAIHLPRHRTPVQ
jgi:site-specific recombinase XerD